MRAAAGALALLFAAPTAAQDRELSTDRPDRTESPFTVPAGRAQIELDLVSHTRDRDERLRQTSIAPFNLKLGIGRDTDVQLIVEPYVREVRRVGTRTVQDGFGDVTLRFKQNLWGNDGGATAFALMPFVKLPTAGGGLGNGRVEGGVIAPLTVTLSETWTLGLMTEIDIVRTGDDRDYVASFVNSATLGLGLSDRVGLYGEIYTERSTESGARLIATFDTGITIASGDDAQFDLGANVGVTRAADDLTLFVGYSRRF